MTILTNQPYASKPRITKKVAVSKDLTIEDLNFIYERPIEYELDDEILNLVEDYRRKNNLLININYKKEVRDSIVINPNRKKN